MSTNEHECICPGLRPHILLLVVLPLLCSTLPTLGQVIITEIMYNPAGADDYLEYIEVYNLGEPVFLTRFSISDGTGTDLLIRPPGHFYSKLKTGEYGLILDSGYWDNGGGIYDEFIPADAVLMTVNDDALGSGGLSNSISETVSLIDQDAITVSERTYLLGAQDGHSEECIQLTGDESNDNWAFSVAGGTPGDHNSVGWPNDLAVSLDEITLEYEEDLESFHIYYEAEVENVETEDSSPRTVEYWLSNAQADLDILLGSGEILPLQPGEVIDVPWDSQVLFPDGDYLATINLSPPDDSAENDSVRSSITFYRPRKNDLALSISEITAEYDNDNDHHDLFFDIAVENVEADTSSPRTLEYRLSNTETHLDTLLGSYDILALPPGSIIDVPWLSSLFVPDGEYVASANLSPADDDAESDTVRSNLTFYTPPDLEEPWFEFSEVMTHPPDYPLASEWIELRVTHPEPFDPSGWGVQDLAGTIARFPDLLSPIVQPDSLIVLTENLDVLNWPGMREDQVIIPENWPILNNDGDQLFLVTPDNRIYGETVIIPEAEKGYSLLYYNDENYPELEGWYPTQYEPYATPGRENWVVYPPNDFSIDNVSTGIQWNIVPGDGDTDSAFVEIFTRSEGWFYMDQIPWRAVAELGSEIITMNTQPFTPSPFPGELVKSVATAHFRDFPYPGQWIVRAELLVDDADLSNNSIVAILTVPYGEIDDPRTSSVEVYPNPFSPDGDGYEDRTVFTFSYPASEIIVTIRLFDSVGRSLGILARDLHLAGDAAWEWNGRRGLSNGQFLPLGLYAYLIDIRSADDSQSWRVKGALACAGGR